jgi:tetratricopeptide (TPR) repeat protein
MLLAIACGAPARAADSPPPPRVFHTPDLAPPPAGTSPGARPLTEEQSRRVLEAQTQRDGGRHDAAQKTLLALLAESPHHPVVLAELARLYLGRQQWAALERLARAERAATRDSLLLGHELTVALERLGRVREAAQVVIEIWASTPGEGEWAEPALTRLEGRDPRAVRDPLRRAVEARPNRIGIVRYAARAAWRHGDGPGALRLLGLADATRPSTPARWGFAEELLYAGAARDTLGAIDALTQLAGDRGLDPAYRMPAARRLWQIALRRDATREGALAIAHALADLPPASWASDLLVGVVRGLREGGESAEVRAILGQLGERRDQVPELRLEAALNELREGPPERALPVLEKAAKGSIEGVFRYAEALFFAGMPDSAARLYQLVSHDPAGPYTGAALERLFLIEDAEPASALPALGRLAYEQWRTDRRRSSALAESLYRSLPRGALWAHAALALGTERERAGDARLALEPLLALADSLPDDRLAPLARQRAGDLYRLGLKDDARALQQYEECLTRYPKAWNASEVRRIVETYRRERRF